jgi:CheY-like chemotaxis protein
MPKVIIADDNSDFVSYVSTVCRRAGWDVETCQNGRVLVETVKSGTGPALLFVDVNMPEMDGIEAIEGMVDLDRPLRLRFVTGGSDAPIVAAKMIAMARDISVGRNVFKPLPKATLLSILEEESGALAELAES